MITVQLVAGWTDDIDMDLLSQDASPSGDMVGMTATLVLRNKDSGALVDTSGDVTIPDTSAWVVRYSPDAADLAVGVYYARVKVTDSGGKVAYFPSGEPDIWIVRAET